jgi:hypothetical protein
LRRNVIISPQIDRPIETPIFAPSQFFAPNRSELNFPPKNRQPKLAADFGGDAASGGCTGRKFSFVSGFRV